MLLTFGADVHVSVVPPRALLCLRPGVRLTSLSGSSKSIFKRSMALTMAMMDWMVLLYTTALYCLHSSSE